MTSRLAALLAAVFTAAVIVPPEGVVVHRHAGGDHLHVHEHLAAGSERGPATASDHAHHEHDHNAEHHHHDQEHAGEHADHHPHEQSVAGDDRAGTLSTAPAGGLAHVHTTPLFHQAASPPPPAAAPPRPLAHATQATPPVHLALARPATRSRGPPARSL